jgi:hypothetical protein
MVRKARATWSPGLSTPGCGATDSSGIDNERMQENPDQVQGEFPMQSIRQIDDSDDEWFICEFAN